MRLSGPRSLTGPRLNGGRGTNYNPTLTRTTRGSAGVRPDSQGQLMQAVGKLVDGRWKVGLTHAGRNGGGDQRTLAEEQKARQWKGRIPGKAPSEGYP